MITDGQKVAIEYTLTLDDGTVVDTNVGAEPLVYEQGGGQILPALERRLAELGAEDRTEVTLGPEEGYGPVHAQAIQEVELERVPEQFREVGTMLAAVGPDGTQVPVKVREVRPETIVLDFNHPLAGQALNFEVRILGVE